MLLINKKEAKSIFQNLSKGYKIIAPVKKIGKGRFSNTNLLTYDEVESLEEIEFFEKTYFSAKSFLFPIRETILEFRGNKTTEAKREISSTIIFLRACDINAIRVMDSHFLKNGEYEDTNYKKCREAITFFLIECKSQFNNCFCVSMETNKTEDYSAFIRKVNDGYEISIKDNDIVRYFSGGKEKKVEPKFVEKDLNPISIPEEIDTSIFNSEIWKEYSRRCSACGRCNTSCPTCACFTLQDIPSEDEEGTWLRRKIWSSCQVKNFALLAGNHDFRIPKGDRMRYKVLHKIRDFKKRVGFNMCVGCGRCDDVCPEYISMFKCIEKINEAILNG